MSTWGQPPANRDEIRQRYKAMREHPREVLEESIIFRSTSMGMQPYAINCGGDIRDITKVTTDPVEQCLVNILRQIPPLYDSISAMLFPLDAEIESAKRKSQRIVATDFQREIFNRRAELANTYTDTALSLFSAKLTYGIMMEPEDKTYSVHDLVERTEGFAQRSALRLRRRGYALFGNRWVKTRLHEANGLIIPDAE